MWPIGESKVVEVVGALNDVEVEFRPDPGQERLCTLLIFYSDDAAARNYSWVVHDGTRAVETPASSLVAGEISAFMFPGYPAKITNQCYVTAKMSALTAGKHLTIVALCEERLENLEMVLLESIYKNLGWPLPPGLEMMKSRLTGIVSGA